MEKENIGETLMHQRIWETLILPKGYQVGEQFSCDPAIFFVIEGSVCFKTTGRDETHTVFPQEMFMAQVDNSYEIIMMEQTHLIICHVPINAWYKEQKWIEKLISKDNFISEGFFKLPVRKMIARYLSLLESYLKEGIHSTNFFELKQQELFFLLFHYYSKEELAQFLQSILSKDMQFKNLVVSNYLHTRNVQELAKVANYSTSGFIKKFQKCFNDSPYQWIQKQKAKQISVEIYQGIKTLQEIANEYKFSSYQHFSVFCKAQLGAPPTVILEKSRIINE